MENGIKGSRIGYNLRQRGGYARAVLARLPPPHLTPAQGCCEISFCVISRNFHEIFNFFFAKFSSNFAKNKIILSKFCVSRNFDKIIFNFVKLEENFAKHKIKIFAKIWQQPYSYTICRLLLTLPFRLLEDSSMQRGNATLI